MKRININIIILVSIIFGIIWQGNAQVQNDEVYEFPALKQLKILGYRNIINIPDLDSFITLKCDFHMHTIFSDGHVWPTMRAIEAWADGLDAIAITDHIESRHRRKKDFLLYNVNESCGIARKKGDELGLLVINGAEITRKKPLGHINAIFLQDISKLDVEKELDAIDEAIEQGAYLILNHPGWPNDTSTLYPIHQELIAKKKLKGVEVFNGSEYYPKALDWCNNHGLTYFANTDLHYASANSYREKLQRPMTLVFAKERSIEGIKEALIAGRTLAYFNNHLAGKEEYLKEFIQKSLAVKVINAEKNTVEILNHSDMYYEIRFGEYMYSIPLFANQALKINIPPGTEILFTNCLISKDNCVKMKIW